MKRKKLISFFSIIALTLGCSNTNVYAESDKLYRAYSLDKDENPNLIIKIIEGENDKIAYCYDMHKSPPESSTSKYKTYYTKQNDFLNSDDEDITIYNEDGSNVVNKVASVLAAAYPIDMYGLYEKSGLTEKEAINIVQQLIWSITQHFENPIAPDNEFFTENERNYYNELLSYVSNEFKQGNLKFNKDITFYNKDGYYATENIDTTGYKGDFTFENLPSSMKVVDAKTNEVLDDNTVNVGDEFYIVSEDKPNESLKLKTKYDYREVLFYFYKYNSGGNETTLNSYQNLVSADLGDNAIMPLSLDIDVDENDTPTLPGGDTDTGNPDNKPTLPDGDTDTSKPDNKPTLPGGDTDTGNPDNKPTLPGGDTDIDNPDEKPTLPGGDTDTGNPDNKPTLPDGDTDINNPDSNPNLPGNGDTDTGNPDNKPTLPGGDTDIGNPDNKPTLPGGDTDTSKPDGTPSLPEDNDTSKPDSNPSLPEDSDTSIYPATGENTDLYVYIALGLISLLILKFSLFKKYN